MNMKNEKGKMKSEKVWKSLLFTFSLLLFTFAANVAAGAGVSVGTPQQRYPWNGKMDIPYTLTGMDAEKTYQLVTTLTVGGATKAVTNELGQVADGNYTTTVDCAALFGTAVSNQTATVKLAVLDYAKPALAVTPAVMLYGPFLIIDLKPDANGQFQTTECDYPPEGAWTKDGGWTDDYKSKYLVLRKVAAGTYPGFQSSQTKKETWKQTAGYWIGVFEVTEAQYDRVMGVSEPSDSLVAKGGIRYDTIRGTSDPSATVAGTSFMTNLCAKCVDERGNKVTGFDLPTEWQWNIAYCAGTTTTYYWGSDQNDADQYAWFNYSDWSKGSGTQGAQVVGLKKPNAWGLYDIAGNVREWCRDVFNDDDGIIKGLADAETYNTQVGNNANSRPLRGGSFNFGATFCGRSSRSSAPYNSANDDNGFRLSRMSSK